MKAVYSSHSPVLFNQFMRERICVWFFLSKPRWTIVFLIDFHWIFISPCWSFHIWTAAFSASVSAIVQDWSTIRRRQPKSPDTRIHRVAIVAVAVGGGRLGEAEEG